MNKFLLPAFFCVALGACTWVKLDTQAQKIRVAYDGNVSGCRDQGKVSVSVRDHVSFYHRSELKVRDELETLARNEAVDMHADTLKPLGDPVDGSQSFGAYSCGAKPAAPHVRGAPADEKKDGVETYPIKN